MHTKPSFNTPSAPLPTSGQLVKCIHSTLLWGFITEESFYPIYFKPHIKKKQPREECVFLFLLQEAALFIALPR